MLLQLYSAISCRLFPIETQNWLISLKTSLMGRGKFVWSSALAPSLMIMMRAYTSWSLLRSLKRLWSTGLRRSSKLRHSYSGHHRAGQFGKLANLLKLPILIVNTTKMLIVICEYHWCWKFNTYFTKFSVFIKVSQSLAYTTRVLWLKKADWPQLVIDSFVCMPQDYLRCQNWTHTYSNVLFLFVGLCNATWLICFGGDICRVNHGLAPGRKRAYMLYKAALKDTATSGESTEEEGSAPATGTSGPPPPHPYHMALGVLSLQKVLVTYCLLFQW